MPKAGFTGIFEEHPNSHTILFGGKYINLTAIARAQGYDLSYMSRVFSGKRDPSLVTLKKLAAVLGMTIDQFLENLEKRVATVTAANDKTVKEHLARLEREAAEDLKRLEQGKTPIPRMPLVA